ncbi:type I glyceraldehyde-3-phosphate dehydrogenase [bacterium]|nr:type I glyceraldehyde-3-phosphate dehydrogenase [bacterium]
MTIRVGINGFGRIGRTVFRAAWAKGNQDFEIVHINDLTDTKTLAHLLKYDSVHGRFDHSVEAADGAIIVDGKKITVSAIKNPEELPWKAKEAQIVFECSGVFTKRAAAEGHLKAGAKKVLISAPATDEDITVVYGVNHTKLDKAKHAIVSNGSCTTNCLAPVAKVVNDLAGIKRGLMTTVHSYTNDQNILDLPHKDMRRARAAAVSMIPTSTGAAKAIGLVMPELKGKMHGLAIRVPTPNVSLVDVTFEVARPVTVEEVNEALKKAANGPLKGILGYTEEPLVSVDFNGDTHSSFVDGASTSVMDGTMVKILSWYDNETGFSWRMLDVARLLMG